jgi:hypothetical protein
MRAEAGLDIGFLRAVRQAGRGKMDTMTRRRDHFAGAEIEPE